MPLPSLPISSFSSPQPNGNQQEPRPASPAAPPYSPITPTMTLSLPAANGASTSNSTAQNSSNSNINPYPYAPPPLSSSLASSPDPLHHAHPLQQAPPQTPHLQPELQQQPHHASSPQPQQPTYPKSTHIPSLPPSLPISESTNPDAMALRAAMSILQIQRQQALRDLKVLEQQKGVALGDPEGFMEGVRDGRVRSRVVGGVGNYRPRERDDYEESDEDEDENQEKEGGEGEGEVSERVSGMEIPGSQNIVRMPPINWAQYHIVGESLNKLHEEQRRRPVGGEVVGEEELRPREKERAEEHVIARPYDPFVDKLAPGGRRAKETQKRKG